MDSQEAVHIHLQRSHEKELLEAASVSERYIIIQNGKIHEENTKLTEEKMTLESRVDELEDQSDRQEESVKYLRGLVKNGRELDLLRLKCMNAETKIVARQEEFSQYMRAYLQAFAIVFLVLSLFFTVVLHFLFVPCVSASVCAWGHIWMLEKKAMEIDRAVKLHMQNIAADKKEIKKIVDAQDYLDQYLDSM